MSRIGCNDGRIDSQRAAVDQNRGFADRAADIRQGAAQAVSGLLVHAVAPEYRGQMFAAPASLRVRRQKSKQEQAFPGAQLDGPCRSVLQGQVAQSVDPEFGLAACGVQKHLLKFLMQWL